MTDRHDEGNSRFLQLFESAYKLVTLKSKEPVHENPKCKEMPQSRNICRTLVLVVLSLRILR